MTNIGGFSKIITKLSKVTLLAFNPRRCLSTRVITSVMEHQQQNTKIYRYYSSTHHPPIGHDHHHQHHKNEEFDKKQSDIYKFDDEQQQQQQQHENNAKEEKVNNLRMKILEASLPFVSSYGWTRKTIEYGAQAIGYESVGVAHGLFPEGGIELIRYFNKKCNEELIEKLKLITKNGTKIMENEEQIKFQIDAIKLRIQMIEPYLGYWPQALAMMSLPQNAPKSLAQLLTLVDDICYYSGDRSVDFEWYTRRIKVATIFKLTETYMLQDSSINHEETWKFLERRMEEITNIEALLSNSQGITKNVQHKLISAFETARNILGLDYNRR